MAPVTDTVTFPRAVYVLHVFKKKSKSGVRTPKPDRDLVRTRFRAAGRHYRTTYRTEEEG